MGNCISNRKYRDSLDTAEAPSIAKSNEIKPELQKQQVCGIDEIQIHGLIAPVIAEVLLASQ